MNPFKYIWLWWTGHFIDVPIEQTVFTVGEEAQIELAQRDYTILKERFARHLCLAKLEAVRSWPVKEAV